MNKFQQDLTGGSVSRQLIKFSLPFLLSNFIQAMYNAADMVIVSFYSGAESASGVANGGQLTIMVMNFVVGLTAGGSVLIAQYFGAKKQEEMKKTIGTMLCVLFIAAAVLSTVMILLCKPILTLIQTPPEAFDEAKDYLIICMVGTVFIFGYNAISAILRGMGDSKRPLIFVSIACVLNVFLDLLLVRGFGMKAAGAAWATIAAQAVSLILSVIYLAKNNFMFEFKLKNFRIDSFTLKNLLKIGLPTSMQNVVVGMSFIIMTALVNGFGVNASAAMGMCAKFNGFAILPAIAMSASVSAMSAQNLGAGFPDRAKKTMLSGIKVVYPISITFFAIAFFAPEWVMRIFTNEPEVIAEGIKYIKFFSFDYLIVPFTFCANGLITGSGHTTFSMINGMMSSIFLRVPIALMFGMALGLGLTGIGIAAPVASMGALTVSTLYLKSGKWLTGGNYAIAEA